MISARSRSSDATPRSVARRLSSVRKVGPAGLALLLGLNRGLRLADPHANAVAPRASAHREHERGYQAPLGASGRSNGWRSSEVRNQPVLSLSQAADRACARARES